MLLVRRELQDAYFILNNVLPQDLALIPNYVVILMLKMA